MPAEIRAWRVLYGETASSVVFETLVREATPAGRVYGLCGLYYRDSSLFEVWLRNLGQLGGRVDICSGTVQMIGCSVSMLIANPDPRTVILDFRWQTLTEWARFRKGDRSYVLDVIGGGYPALLRFGPPVHALDKPSH